MISQFINFGVNLWFFGETILKMNILCKIVVIIYELYKTQRSVNITSYKNENNNTYALVTGASGGFGKCFSEELAKAGYNLILVARNKNKLETFSSFLKVKYNIQIRCVIMDFLKNERAACENIFDQLKNLDIGVVVNNLGISTKNPMYLHELSDLDIDSILHINVFTTTMMTCTAVKMFKNRKHTKSLLINVSSSCGFIPTPLQSVYGASKSYVSNFTKALSYEYKDTIDFLNVAPGDINSFYKNLNADKHKYISNIFNSVGIRITTNPYWWHSVIDCLGTTFFTKNAYTNILFNLALRIRKSKVD
tara:strand:- start:258 stop:1178 length:921 start_codon:yes stop_codon:yes gene_type:complete